MSIQHIERRASAGGGRKPFNRAEEKFSEYFQPENGERKVLRYELLAILTQVKRAEANMKWWRRLWSFLRSPIGSGPVDIAEQPEGEPVAGKPAEGRGNE